MAKLYRKKRVTTAYSNRLEGDERWHSNYEIGHILYGADLPLPADAPLHMRQGYSNAAKQADEAFMATFRRLYRCGLVSVLPAYRYMVQGIKPFHLETRAIHPLKRGQSERLPARAREKQAAIRRRYVKAAFG